jgi:hypothetical protein
MWNFSLIQQMLSHRFYDCKLCEWFLLCGVLWHAEGWYRELNKSKVLMEDTCGKESEDLPYLYWIPKLHKTPYKESNIAGSSICSTKELSIQLTKILSAVKEGQQQYCETVY